MIRVAGWTGVPKQPNEMSVFGFAVAKLDPKVMAEKKAWDQFEIVKLLNSRRGFAGILQQPESTLCLFQTKEQAELAREEVALRKWPIGSMLVEYYVPKKDLA